MIQAIVFDFDGTLVDTNAIKRAVFYRVTAGVSGATDALDRIFEDPNCGDRYDVFATLRAQLGPSAVDTAGLAKAYGQRCEERILEIIAKSRVMDILDQLKAEGYILFLASATPQADLVAMLDKSPLAGRFTAIYGRPTGKADILCRIVREYGLQLSTVVMIGDGEDDWRGASEAGCRFVGVGSHTTAFAGKADTVIESIEDLTRPGFFAEMVGMESAPARVPRGHATAGGGRKP